MFYVTTHKEDVNNCYVLRHLVQMLLLVQIVQLVGQDQTLAVTLLTARIVKAVQVSLIQIVIQIVAALNQIVVVVPLIQTRIHAMIEDQQEEDQRDVLLQDVHLLLHVDVMLIDERIVYLY